MMAELITVDDYNAAVRARRDAAKWSGILCPACKALELQWGMEMTMSMPPKRAVMCVCGWRGYVDD